MRLPPAPAEPGCVRPRRTHVADAHPEYGITPGVETTSGPLGQGVTNAVGFALAEKLLANEFNREGHTIVNHHTYVFLGDGCLMEGISHEAAALAGAWKLNKLIALYDDNGISIDGKVEGWFTDDTPKRFEAYGWNVIRAVDGHDAAAVSSAIAKAKSADKPTLICCKTIIGWGSPNKAGKESSHGAPLGADEITKTREQLGWPHAPFEIPQDIRDGWNKVEKGATAQRVWTALFVRYAAEYPKEAAELRRRIDGRLPDDWSATVAKLQAAAMAVDKPVATRKSSQNALNLIAPHLPEFLGGSADLTDSNLTRWEGALTSKPFRYSARTWELSRRKSVSPHDSTGANLIVQVKNHKVMRVVPLENEAVNECWIADRDRFSCEGFYSADRAVKPLLKQGGAWREVFNSDAAIYGGTDCGNLGAVHGTEAMPHAWRRSGEAACAISFWAGSVPAAATDPAQYDAGRSQSSEVGPNCGM